MSSAAQSGGKAPSPNTASGPAIPVSGLNTHTLGSRPQGPALADGTPSRMAMLLPQPPEINADPKSFAAKSFDKAMQLINQGDTANAYPLLVAVVTYDPAHAAGWWHLSTLHFSSRNFTAAHRAMEKVNQLNPNNPHILTNLGWYAHVDEHTEDALTYLQKATRLGPHLALAWSNLSQVQIALNDLTGALSSARRAVDLCIDGNPVPKMSLAFTYLFNGNLQEGMRWYNARFKYKLPQFLNYAFPIWEGQRVDTLFLRAEQGIGDTISTLRFLPECATRCKKALCYVNAELRTLVEDMNISNVEVFSLPSILPAAADAWLPMMSLPLALGVEMSDLGSYAAPFVPVYPPQGRQGQDLTTRRIGLVWGGNPDNDLDRWRGIPLQKLFPLFSVPNTRFYSLQLGPPKDQITTQGAYGFLEDLASSITDIRDTARIISTLDLVITSCTAVAHLSSAMNKPTWVLRNRRASDWRWGLGERIGTPWYTSTRIFERDYHESWDTVVTRVWEALSA